MQLMLELRMPCTQVKSLAWKPRMRDRMTLSSGLSEAVPFSFIQPWRRTCSAVARFLGSCRACNNKHPLFVFLFHKIGSLPMRPLLFLKAAQQR